MVETAQDKFAKRIVEALRDCNENSFLPHSESHVKLVDNKGNFVSTVPKIWQHMNHNELAINIQKLFKLN